MKLIFNSQIPLHILRLISTPGLEFILAPGGAVPILPPMLGLELTPKGVYFNSSHLRECRRIIYMIK